MNWVRSRSFSADDVQEPTAIPELKTFVPCLPESAPFSPEQRAYLNGFLAGLFSYTEVSPAGAAAVPAPAALKPLTILWGSQTGTCEGLAKRMAKEAGKKGYAATVVDMATFEQARLGPGQRVLCVASTFGDGEPPDNARVFSEFLASAPAGLLDGTRFSVCGLGDRNYAQFCAFGAVLDQRLEALGGTRVTPRAECDVEYEVTFSNWLGQALTALDESSAASASAPAVAPAPAQTAVTTSESREAMPAKWSKSNPYPGTLILSDRLSGSGSAKDVRHVVFELTDPALRYEPGDALGVFPRNDPALVEELLQSLGATGDEVLAWGNGPSGSLRDALLTQFDITRIPTALLEYFAKVSGDAELGRVISPEANGERTRFLFGREIIDLFNAFPSVQPSPAEFLGLLRKLQPRLYSIASSPRLHPGEVHLTVGTVRYESLGRPRQGVCSTYLADRAPIGARVPLFIHENPSFRPPNDSTDLIMVGPGTGIAPFRAFLEDRAARGARGRNWLFFGDQRASTDFLYRTELESFQSRGVLHRLDLAWSRDQGHKVYVQDKMREHASEVWSWLEGGAGFYVCGDASRMAKDVDAALQEVIQRAGGKSAEQAAAYVRELKSAKRYRRDVY